MSCLFWIYAVYRFNYTVVSGIKAADLNEQEPTAVIAVRPCSPLRQKFMECSINNPALMLLMKHLVIGQRPKTPYFSAFHWSPRGSLVSIGQHFVATRVVHLPKVPNKFNYRIGPKLT